MKINNVFELGEIVYLKTDVNQLPRIIYSIEVGPYQMVYHVMQGTTSSTHFDIEMSREKDIMLQLDITEREESR